MRDNMDRDDRSPLLSWCICGRLPKAPLLLLLMDRCNDDLFFSTTNPLAVPSRFIFFCCDSCFLRIRRPGLGDGERGVPCVRKIDECNRSGTTPDSYLRLHGKINHKETKNSLDRNNWLIINVIFYYAPLTGSEVEI